MFKIHPSITPQQPHINAAVEQTTSAQQPIGTSNQEVLIPIPSSFEVKDYSLMNGALVRKISPVTQTKQKPVSGGPFTPSQIKEFLNHYNDYRADVPEIANPNGNCIDILNSTLCKMYPGLTRKHLINPKYAGKTDDTSLILAETVDYTMEQMIKLGWVSAKQSISSHYTEDNTIDKLNGNVQETMLGMVKGKGQFMFGVSAGSGYHTTAVIMDNRVTPPTFTFVDTDETEVLSKDKMQKRYLKEAQYMQGMSVDRLGVQTRIYLMNPPAKPQQGKWVTLSPSTITVRP